MCVYESLFQDFYVILCAFSFKIRISLLKINIWTDILRYWGEKIKIYW